MKPVRYIFAAFFLATWAAGLFAQSPAGFMNDITRKFQAYIGAVPREEVFLHTDRTDYIAGESVWFTAWVFDRRSSLPSPSSIVYVELLSDGFIPVIQKRIKVSNGSGPGEIALPDTLGTGRYIIRAYTGWMKNFLPENCFIRRLNIYNALNPSEKVPASLTGSKEFLIDSSMSAYAGTGFRVTTGKRTDTETELIIDAGESFREANNNTFGYLIHTRGVINLTGIVSMTGATTILKIPASSLTPGINHVTFFSISSRPVAEKFLITGFRKEVLDIDVSGPAAGNRDKVSVRITAPSSNGVREVVPAFSISVSDLTEDQPGRDLPEWMIFGSEFGELPGHILEAVARRMDDTAVEDMLRPLRSNWIDWEKILAGRLPVISYLPEYEDHFLTGRLINSDTRSPAPGQFLFLSLPGKNPTFQYSLTSAGGNFVFSVPAGTGLRDMIIQPENFNSRFSIELNSSFPAVYPDEKLSGDTSSVPVPGIISDWSSNYQVNRIYGINYTEKTFGAREELTAPRRFYGKPDVEIKMDDYIKLPVMEEVFYELIPGVSLRKKRSGYDLSVIDPPEFKTFPKPPTLMVDGVIIHDADIIANLDPEKVERIDVVKERYFVGDYLFYGIISVVTREGDFESVPLPDNAVRLRYSAADPPAIFRCPDYSGEGSRKSRIPDFRNTLYWNPSVRLSDAGQAEADFWTSDRDGIFEILVQGISTDGRPVSARKILEVKRSPEK